MKLVYIAHTIGGDQYGNMLRLATILRYLRLRYNGEMIAIAPYASDLIAMHDDTPEERTMAMRACHEVIARTDIDELWACGKISSGVAQEISAAQDKGIVWKLCPQMHEEAEAWLSVHDAQPKTLAT